MYSIGDLIIYGNMGVFRIVDISAKDLSEETRGQLHYTMKALYQECTVYVPVDNTKVFMRPVISKEEAEKLIDTIPTIQAEAYHTRVLSDLSRHYEEILKTHDCADLIELTMSIYAKKQMIEEQKKKFGSVDERFMKKAEELLFGELSAVLGIPRSEVSKYIASRVDALNAERRENYDECC